MEGSETANAMQLPTSIPFWRLVLNPGAITQEVADYPCEGSGTEEDPYVVQWMPKDFRNPLQLKSSMKWFITLVAAIETLVVALVSSAYTGGLLQIKENFGTTTEVATLGVSLYVLGFALGPLIWAPMSELFGRQIVFITTYCGLTIFCAACTGATNIETMLVFRFLSGAFGSSPLTNSGGVIADMFMARERGLALSAFALAPFLGPVIGPIAGGFLGESSGGWKWVMGLLAILCAVMWFLGAALKPETYAPVLLRQRAKTLSKLTGKVYCSKLDIDQGRLTLKAALKISLSRPMILLFQEPIVLLLSIYLAIIYGTLYMLFGAFPIVYQVHRGWSQGIGGLAFIGVMIGMIGAVAYSIPENKRYAKLLAKNGGYAPPEARLPPCMLASIALPIGLFWFAWTNDPSIHWLASVAAGVPFGFGMLLVFLSVFNYLIDAYTIFAASVLAANTLLRSLFGFAFPLFTTYMYQDLGIHWASCIPAFLALACVPFPFLLYKYGLSIRNHCKYAAQSEAFVQNLLRGLQKANEEAVVAETEKHPSTPDDDVASLPNIKETSADVNSIHHTLSRSSTNATHPVQRVPTYEANPYNVDRVHTRESFK
ncbi:Major facilitator superfamily domain general substrate transporter [Penicillium cf. griseofulvum]|uniref:Major facilitator superfamily domain general substrate transporter n=1 Tax=Penicillium cf. griseofulvum TaxID=2972120 RepID=A0A9W9T248_9EURO|nr:Major facilitator superfamily domain general substrate transporter [Penicillium cf. griseofulvum]KAJ5440482.1 Major facilitator superfamily domain general substrate transporter [Penicillium cf. griseofulvum]